jgi:peptide/nickel transport system permease protein
MIRIASQRIAQLVPVVVGVSLITFFVLSLLPGSEAIAALGQTASASQIQEFDRQMGLDHSLPVRYWNWLTDAVQGNLGMSAFSHHTVVHMISAGVPVSVELTLVAIGAALLFAVPSAILAARRPGGVGDNITRFVSMMSISVPGFVLGLLLVIPFSIKLHWVPATGFVPLSQGLGQNLRSIAVPAVSIAVFLYALYLRVLRGDMVQHLATEEYVTTARAKGASEWRVLTRHVLHNAIFGLLTVVALNVGTLIGVEVIIEQVFGLPGVGQTLITAVFDKDSAVVEGIVLCLAVVVVLSNLAVDLLYLVLDPRTRDGR